jgi:hypothetical protein
MCQVLNGLELGVGSLGGGAELSVGAVGGLLGGWLVPRRYGVITGSPAPV